MTFFETYAKEIVSLTIPFIAWAISRFFRARARLNLSQPHNFTFLVDEPLRGPSGDIIIEKQTVHTKSIMLVNAGSETATKVEIVFNWKPMFHNIWPPRHLTTHIEGDGRYVLIFESLSPGEIIGCEILSINSPLPELVTARCDQCVSKIVEMYPQPVVSSILIKFSIFLCALGAAAIIYSVLILMQFLILKTPFGH